MIKKLLMTMILSSLVYGGNVNIQIKKDSWNLIGISEDFNLSTLNLNIEDIVWQYKESKWYCNQENDTYSTITSLKANDAIWVYSNSDQNVTLNNNINNFTTLKSGWSMYSFDYDKNLDDINQSLVPLAWQYSDNNWSVWDPKNLISAEYTQKNTLNKGEGVWVYGMDTGLLDSVENIWNLSLPIDTAKDYSNLNIALQFEKPEADGTPDTGTFTFENLSIINSALTLPSKLYTSAKTDSGSISNVYDSSYNPNNVMANTVSFDGNNLLLKLGTIVQLVKPDDVDKFKSKAVFNISIIADQNIFENNISSMELIIEIR